MKGEATERTTKGKKRAATTTSAPGPADTEKRKFVVRITRVSGAFLRPTYGNKFQQQESKKGRSPERCRVSI